MQLLLPRWLLISVSQTEVGGGGGCDDDGGGGNDDDDNRGALFLATFRGMPTANAEG